MRKSTVIKHAFHGFRDFEAAFNGCQTGEMNFCEIGAHPYLWENTSESGIVSLFGNGAQAAAIVERSRHRGALFIAVVFVERDDSEARAPIGGWNLYRRDIQRDPFLGVQVRSELNVIS